MNLFEGLSNDSPRDCKQQHSTLHRSQPVRCWSWGAGVLLVDVAGATCVAQLSTEGSSTPCSSPLEAYQLHANVQDFSQPGQLLCACGPGPVRRLQAADYVGRLTLVKQQGRLLQLYAASVAAAATAAASQQHMQHQLQLLAEFEHDAFADLDVSTCHVLPGPVLLLQPEPWQLLLLQPALNPSAACATPAAGPPQSPAWQLSELHLPTGSLLQAVAQDFQDVHHQLLASCADSSKASGQPGSLTAAAPWQLLHSSCAQDDADQLQLLLAMPVACAGRHAAGQQRSVLLCTLHVATQHMRTTPSGQVGAGLAVAWCHALQWSALPACGVTFERCDSFAAQGSCRQLVAVGSQDGSLHVLDSSSSAHRCSSAPAALQQQWQHHPRSDDSAALCTAQLPGEIHSVVYLPHAHVSGVSHAGVLAVLHNQHAGIIGSNGRQHGRSMAVSFLRLQEGGQMQELAVVQGPLGLCAPTHSALGVLCPFGPARTPQQQDPRHAADAGGHAQRLAAVIIMDGSTAGMQDSSQWGGAAAAGLGCHAWLASSHAGGLPGPLLGILAAAPATQQQQAEHAETTVTGTGATAGRTTVRDGNELQGIRSMLAVLEQRWQQGTRELCSLQQRVMTAQRLAAAGHKRLCQLAADTLHHSIVRQYVVPLSNIEPQVALATYNAGRQLAEQQRQHAAPQAAGDVGPMQLLLQVVRVSSSLQGQQLQLQVCVRPELQCLCAQGQRSTTWSGALLRLCHAELLLWHAGGAGVTANSTWCWDAVSGHLTASSAVAVEVLLQLYSASANRSACAAAGSAQAAGSSTGTLADGQTKVASALAAAAERVAACAQLSGTSSAAGVTLWQGVQLHAAVAVSACCSSQAAVQWDAHPWQQHSTVAQRVLQRAQLLTPAMALLHLPPFQVAAQDLLMQQLTGSMPSRRAATMLHAQPAAATAAQPAGHDGAQTPIKASAAGHVAARGRHSSIGLSSGVPDVVPPTPCSADESEGELGGVIPDSQEDEDEQQQGLHDSRQQLQEWWQTQQQRQQTDAAGQQEASAPAPGCVGAEGMDWEAGQDSDRATEHAASTAGISRQLLLQSGIVDLLQLLPTVLQRMQCFQLLHGTGRQQQLMLPAAGGPHATGQSALDQHHGGDHDCAVGFAALGAQEALVTLRAPNSQSLGRLQQLLLLAVRQLPGEVNVHASCLDPSMLGRLAAATQAVAGVAHLHVKVLKDILQQLPGTRAMIAQQDSTAAPAQPSFNRHLQHAADAGSELQLVVSGRQVGTALSECWLCCLKAQADVDLAVSGLCNLST